MVGYSFEFLLDESGLYEVVAAWDGATENITDRFELIIDSEARKVIGQLKEASSVSEVKRIIADNAEAFASGPEIVEVADTMASVSEGMSE